MRKIGLSLWALALLLAACTGATRQTVAAASGSPLGFRSNDVEAGQLVAQRNCAGCHAIGPMGTSPNPKSPPFRVLVTRYRPDDLAESLAEGIVTGHANMPAVMLQPVENAQLIAYLKSLPGQAN